MRPKTHTFAVCAYGDSPYLCECIESLLRQKKKTRIIICTSTPLPSIKRTADTYGLPLFVRDGKSGIGADWNFAVEMSDTDLVTLAHQDDIYTEKYAEAVTAAWEMRPDTTVFFSDADILCGDRLSRGGMVETVKRLLRVPLRFPFLADKRFIKRLVLSFGNPVVCPSCTYDREKLKSLGGFSTELSFVLDWDMLLRLARLPGRFFLSERPLICYRRHGGAATNSCIQDKTREKEETEMFRRLLPGLAFAVMPFYKKAYCAYDKKSDDI